MQLSFVTVDIVSDIAPDSGTIAARSGVATVAVDARLTIDTAGSVDIIPDTASDRGTVAARSGAASVAVDARFTIDTAGSVDIIPDTAACRDSVTARRITSRAAGVAGMPARLKGCLHEFR